MNRLLTLSAALAAISIATSGVVAATAAAPSPRVLRTDGIGPLKLGMKRADALATGWLKDRRPGCKLGGAPYPITYRIAGTGVPSDIRGTAEFQSGRLRNLSFTRGVHTSLGVTVGRTTTARMADRYRKAGYSVMAQFDETFQGTFVNVSRNGKRVIGGFGEGAVVAQLGLPHILTCE